MSRKNRLNSLFSLNQILFHRVLEIPSSMDPETGLLCALPDFQKGEGQVESLLEELERKGFEIGVFPSEKRSCVYVFEKGDKLLFGFAHPNYENSVIGASLLASGIDPREHGIHGEILFDVEEF